MAFGTRDYVSVFQRRWPILRRQFFGGIEYLGVELDLNGETHYGWIEVESRPLATVAIVHRWAYESEPGVPIFAGRIPEPSAIALLPAGLALAARRSRRA